MDSFRHELSNGDVVAVERCEIQGLASVDDSDDDGEGYILLDRRLRKGSREEMNVAIHELLHCEFREHTEDEIDALTTSFQEYLWKLGFRRVK